MNNILDVVEHPAIEKQINHSTFAHHDLDRAYKRLVCTVDGMDEHPKKAREDIIMNNPIFFRDDVILVTLKHKK